MFAFLFVQTVFSGRLNKNLSETCLEKTCFANNKNTDQPTKSRSLINALIVSHHREVILALACISVTARV